MRNLILIFSLSIFCYTVALPQISGRVVDSQTGAGLQGATILSDNDLRASTNADGYFSLALKNEDRLSLRISFVGYAPKLLEVSKTSSLLLIEMDPEIQTIQEIIVTVSGITESLLNSTGSVSSLSLQNLQFHNSLVLNDAVNQVPGLNMSGGGYNTNRLTIRGIGSRSPYGSNRIRAYLNDIPLTTGDGTTSIEEIDIAAMGRIEVLKGPSSAVYGSGLGGAIRMWSLQPTDDDFSFTLSSEAGSFGAFRSFVRAGHKSEKGSQSLFYSNSRTDGFRQNSRYSRNSLLFTSNRSLRNTGFKFTLIYTGVEAQIPSSVNLSSFNSDPRLAAPNWLAVKGFEKYGKLLAGISADTQLKPDLSNKLSIFTSFSDPYESRPFNIIDEKSMSAGIQDQIHLSHGKFEIVAGAEVFLEGYNWKIFETVLGEQGELLADNREKRFYLNTYALTRFKPGKNFTAEFGLNLNVLNYSLDDFFAGDSTDLGGDYRYDPVLSPRLGINYRMGPQSSLHASAGHGFSAPSPEETLLPDGQINTGLKPETGWNFDTGIRGKIHSGRLSYDLTAYYIALSDLLVTKRISEEIFTGINAGKTNHLGIEALLSLEVLSPTIREEFELGFTSSFSVSKNSFIDFTDNDISYSGNSLPGIPSATLYNEMQMKLFSAYGIIVTHRFTGKQFMNDSNTSENGGWQIIDFRLSYSGKIGERQHRIQIYGGVKNLFDTNYAGMILVNAPSFGGAAPRYYYPALPRNYFGGVILEFL